MRGPSYNQGRNAVVDLEPLAAASTRLRSFSSSTAIVVLSQFVRYGLTLAAWTIIARLLGPKAVGEVQIAYLLPAWVLLLTNLGLPLANIYFLSKRTYSLPLILGHALLRWCAESLLVMSVLLLGRTFVLKFVPLPPQMYYVIVLWIPLQILNSYLTSILTAQMRFAEQFWINLVQGSSVILFVFLVVSTLNSTVTGAIAALVAATVVTDVLQLWFVRYGIQRYEMWPSFQLMRCCLSFGLRGYFANLAQFVTYRFDSFIVGSMLGMSALGVYAGAYTASEILFYIPNCIATVVFPATAGSSTEAANWRTAAVCRMTFTFAFIAGLVGATTAHWLYPAILGDKFSYSTVLFWALLPGTVMLSGTKVMTADMLGRGFPQYASRGSIGAMILVAILDLCFIPRLGLIAAAIISSLVYGLQTAYYVSCFLRVTGLRLATLVLVTGDDLRILKGLVFAYTKPLIGKLIPLHEAK